MWTQFIKIFVPRLSLCLFTRSFCCLFIFLRSSLASLRLLCGTRTDRKWKGGRKDMKWKKLSSFRLFLMVSHLSISGTVTALLLLARKKPIFKDSVTLKKPLLLFAVYWCEGGINKNDPRKGEEKWGKSNVVWHTLGNRSTLFVCSSIKVRILNWWRIKNSSTRKKFPWKLLKRKRIL